MGGDDVERTSIQDAIAVLAMADGEGSPHAINVRIVDAGPAVSVAGDPLWS
jgi:hypothetical protein